MSISKAILSVFCLGAVLLSEASEDNLSSPFKPVDEFVAQANCFRLERRLKSRRKPRGGDSRDFQIIVNLDRDWDESSVPIPLNVKVCNNGSEGATVLTFELIIKDTNGTRVLPLDDTKTGVDGSGERTLKVIETSGRGPSIEPKKEFSRTILIGKEYGLIASKEYTVTIRQILSLPGSAKMIELTSLPIKLVLKAPKK